MCNLFQQSAIIILSLELPTNSFGRLLDLHTGQGEGCRRYHTSAKRRLSLNQFLAAADSVTQACKLKKITVNEFL